VRLALVLVAAALLAIPAAFAKDFQPGDLKICGRDHCVPIQDRKVLKVLSSLYWGPGRPRRAQPVHAGARAFELRFGDDYASGMVASRGLDRFRAYGFYCGRFQRGKWYRVPARAVVAFLQLTKGLRPATVPRVPPPSC
jgi:hypothetical protein